MQAYIVNSEKLLNRRFAMTRILCRLPGGCLKTPLLSKKTWIPGFPLASIMNYNEKGNPET